jgi:hypothetical protein
MVHLFMEAFFSQQYNDKGVNPLAMNGDLEDILVSPFGAAFYIFEGDATYFDALEGSLGCLHTSKA